MKRKGEKEKEKKKERRGRREKIEIFRKKKGFIFYKERIV